MKIVIALSAIAAYSALSATDGTSYLKNFVGLGVKAFDRNISSRKPQLGYITASVTTGDIRKTIIATGAVTAKENVEVGSQLSGQIAKLLVDFNDPVTKGQVLAVLDDGTFKQTVLGAQATVAEAEANLVLARQGVERARLSLEDAELQEPVLKAKVDQARAEWKALAQEASRQAILAHRGVSAVKLLGDAIAKRDAAAAALREAQAVLAAHANAINAAELDIARAETTEKEAHATRARTDAALRLAQINLGKTRIRAPIDGVIVGRSVDKGQTLATALEAHTLFTIAGDLKNIEVYARVDESDIGKIKNGQKATFTVDAYPHKVFSATVKQIRMAPQIEQNVVTYTVVLKADNPKLKLLPGMTALVSIIVSHVRSTMEVPLAALRFSPGAQKEQDAQLAASGQGAVWLKLANGPPLKTVVKLGDDDGRNIAVSGGKLSPGAKVIVGVRHGPNHSFVSGS